MDLRNKDLLQGRKSVSLFLTHIALFKLQAYNMFMINPRFTAGKPYNRYNQSKCLILLVYHPKYMRHFGKFSFGW